MRNCQKSFSANSKHQLIHYHSHEVNVLKQENLNSHIPLSHNSEQHHLVLVITHEITEDSKKCKDPPEERVSYPVAETPASKMDRDYGSCS